MQLGYLPALQVRRSKLHFVDLAGSERVGKSGLAAHMQLKEAKYINLSLHFLEQVSAGRWVLGWTAAALPPDWQHATDTAAGMDYGCSTPYSAF